MSSNARIGVDVKDMKRGLQQARDAVKELKSEFNKLSSEADTLNNKEEKLNNKMSIISTTTKKYSDAVSDLRKITDACEDEVDKLKQKKEQLKKQLEDAEKATSKDEKAISRLTIEIKNCEKEITAKEKALTKNKILLNETDTEVNKLKKTYDNYEKELEDVRKELENVNKEVADSGDETDVLGDTMEELGIKTMSAQDALGKLSDVANNVRDSVNEITDSFEELVKDGIQKTAEELSDLALITEEYGVKSETALAKAQTLLTGDMYDKANELIREQTKLFGSDYSDIAEGWYQALSAAVPNEKIEGFTETAGKLSIAGFTDSATTIDALTTIINSYKFSHDEAARLASILIATQNYGKTTVGEIGSELSKVASTGSISGVPFEDLMVAASYTTQGGIVTADTMTALNRMILELSDVTSNASKVLVKQTGMTFKELIEDGADLRDVLEVLGTAGESAALILGEEFIITKSKLDESLFEKAKSVEDVMKIAKDNGADLSTSITDIFSEIRSQKAAGALFDQTSRKDYRNRLNEYYSIDDSLLEQQFEHLIATTENQKNIFKQTWQDVLVEMWMGGEASRGLQSYFGEALEEANSLSNEFIDSFDFSIIDEIGQAIKTTILQICNIIRNNKDLILILISSLSNFIIQLIEYLPEFVENILPELLELVILFLEKAPALLELIPSITDLISFIIDNLPAIMGFLYSIQIIFSGLSAAFEIGSIILAFKILASLLGTTIPAMAGAAGSAIAGLAGPIGIAIGVISLLITFFVTAYTKSEFFRNELGKLADKISGALSEAISSITDEFEEFKDILNLTDEKVDLLGEGLGILASGISGIIGDSLILIINIFEGIVQHVMYTIELFDLFGKIVRGTFTAIKTGDWSDVIANVAKAMETKLKDIFLPVNVLLESFDEMENKTQVTRVEATKTPFVDIDIDKLMADVDNFNNSVNNNKTPIINNDYKLVTSNNYFYSPKALDERTILKNDRYLLDEALFSAR